jgi:hypothetical protein
VKVHVENVLASRGVTVLEGNFENPPEYPFHCPPALSQVNFYRGGRIQRVRFYYAPRPEREEDQRAAARRAPNR